MAMFGFVYLWYLMAVLILEIWLDYRRDIVLLSQRTKGLRRFLIACSRLARRTSTKMRFASTSASATSLP